MSRNPNARVRAAKQAREVRQWQAIAAGDPQPRAKSGWCATGAHEGCQRRPAVALQCPCPCHRKDPR